MNNEERLFYESNKFQAIAQKSISATGEKWLNIAYKLDYISLQLKEKIDALLRKKDEIQQFHINHSISDQDIMDMITITEIASNTKFSSMQLNSIK